MFLFRINTITGAMTRSNYLRPQLGSIITDSTPDPGSKGNTSVYDCTLRKQCVGTGLMRTYKSYFSSVSVHLSNNTHTHTPSQRLLLTCLCPIQTHVHTGIVLQNKPEPREPPDVWTHRSLTCQAASGHRGSDHPGHIGVPLVCVCQCCCRCFHHSELFTTPLCSNIDVLI